MSLAVARGANVVLIFTVDLPNPPGVEVVKVESATEMHQAVTQRNDADVIVMAAAVADFRPKGIADSKIKKDGGPPEVVLEQTVDILADLGARKQPGQIIVGFAAETDDLLANAKQKLERKKIDLIETTMYLPEVEPSTKPLLHRSGNKRMRNSHTVKNKASNC